MPRHFFFLKIYDYSVNSWPTSSFTVSTRVNFLLGSHASFHLSLKVTHFLFHLEYFVESNCHPFVKCPSLSLSRVLRQGLLQLFLSGSPAPGTLQQTLSDHRGMSSLNSPPREAQTGAQALCSHSLSHWLNKLFQNHSHALHLQNRNNTVVELLQKLSRKIKALFHFYYI